VRKWHPLDRIRCERSSVTASPSDATRSRRCVIEIRAIDSDRDGRWGDHVNAIYSAKSRVHTSLISRVLTTDSLRRRRRRRRTSRSYVDAWRREPWVGSCQQHPSSRCMCHVPLLMLAASSFLDAVSRAARDTSLGNYSALRRETAVSFTRYGTELADTSSEFCRRC